METSVKTELVRGEQHEDFLCIFSKPWNNLLLSLLESRAPLNCYRNVVHLKEVVFPIWANRSFKSIYFPFTLFFFFSKIIITVVISHSRGKRPVACEYSGCWTGFSAGRVGERLSKHSPSPLPPQLTLNKLWTNSELSEKRRSTLRWVQLTK